VTGLDRIGIPVWTAMRPNGLAISVTQGKGVDDDAAVASAIFEGIEVAIAERPHPLAFTATPAQLAADGREALQARRFLKKGHSEPEQNEDQRWVEGLDLISGKAVFAPEELVGMVDAPGRRYCSRSDGLGAGSNLLEAAIHGICELIERDATALWSFRSDEQIARREVAPLDMGSRPVIEAGERIADAGLRLRLFDITSDISVPTFLALIMPAGSVGAEIGYLDLAAGSGTHPVAARAALRAITEAAQTRLTTITGSRDDVDPDEYRRRLPEDLATYTGPAKAIAPWKNVASEHPGDRSLSAYLDWLIDKVRARGIKTLTLVPFEAPDFPFVLARTIAPDLEQDPRSRNRNLGRRALSAMLRQQ